MNCYPLAYTGIGLNIGLLLIIAIGAVLLGAAMVFATRHRRRRARAAAATLVVLSLVVVAFVVPPGAPAQASSSDCGANGATTDNSLTVTQTSTMNDLAPGRAPVAIAGLVVNNSLDSTYITAVKVEITSVTVLGGAFPGPCDAGDYFLLNARMLVERTLGPGGSTPFTGASIGLKNKPTNQDACQLAVIHLLYTANPGPPELSGP
ncbi:hypothetical protein [Amycolatopsis sp. Hca4]|uniref:hypothetical protein n=1 Tax=Amycolatopsis sp. Hca4 TaxID=2742131 RepID=UPI0020CADEA5|nr:hypothetical protein [Amycolatopsis sp. Hca4]